MADFWNFILYSKCLYCFFIFFQLLLNETRFFYDEIILFNRIYLNEISRRYRFWWSWNVCMNIIVRFNKWSVNLWHHSFADTSVPLFDFFVVHWTSSTESNTWNDEPDKILSWHIWKFCGLLDIYLFTTKNVIVLLTIQFKSEFKGKIIQFVTYSTPITFYNSIFIAVFRLLQQS